MREVHPTGVRHRPARCHRADTLPDRRRLAGISGHLWTV